MSAELTSLFDRLRSIQSAWVARGWSWDRRFECVASTFDVVDAPQARELVSSALDEVWNHGDRFEARAMGMAEATGGLRSDQLLFTTPEASVIAYGMWWPWGSEVSNISMRVGLTGRVSFSEHEQLRQLFGALDD